MGKYEPLNRYLKRQRQQELELSFSEIERVIRRMLPKSAAKAQWWSGFGGLDTSDVQQNAWRDAGYDASLIEGRERVRFQRSRPASDTGSDRPTLPTV